MRFVYKWHAQMRMMQRNVSESDVEEVVKNPDNVQVGGDGVIEAWKTINREKIKVVYTVRDGSIVVITVATR